VKNVRVTRRQNCPEAIIEDRPGGVFAARSASEIRARQQNRSALIPRMIQHEIRIGFLAVEIAPVVKKHAAITFAREKFQKLFRHHLIRINIHAIQWRDQPCVFCERLHSSALSVIPLRTLCLSFSRPFSRSTRPRPHSSTCECPRNVLRLPPPQPSADSPDASALLCPGGLRNYGLTCSRNARRSAAHRHSCRCTCCSPRHATRIPLARKPCRDLPPPPQPSRAANPEPRAPVSNPSTHVFRRRPSRQGADPRF